MSGSNLTQPFSSNKTFTDKKNTLASLMENTGESVDKEGCFAILVHLIEHHPAECDDIFDITPEELFDGYVPNQITTLWKTLSTHRPELAPAFLRKAFTETTPLTLWVYLAEMELLKPNMNMVKDLVERAASIHPKMKPEIMQVLMDPAMNYAIKGGYGIELFDYVLENADVSRYKWDDHFGSGNAIYKWIQCHRNGASGQARKDSVYIFNQLRDAGVALDERLSLQYDDIQVYFNSPMDLACWALDQNRPGYEDVIDAMIRSGIPWGDRDQGNGFAAAYLKEHPFVRAKTRRKGLEDYIEKGEIEKKTIDGPKTRM